MSFLYQKVAAVTSATSSHCVQRVIYGNEILSETSALNRLPHGQILQEQKAFVIVASFDFV